MFRKVERLPGSNHLHRWADWAEILCIYEGVLTAPDLGTEVEKRQDSIHIEAEDDREPDDHSHEPLSTPFSDSAEFLDAVTLRASDTFALIASRAAVYGDAYPFELDVRSRKITLRCLRADRVMYLFLLVCSGFRYIQDRSLQTDLAGRFEWLSLQVMRKQFPPGAEVHLFGANPIPGAHFGVEMKERVKRLAHDIRETLLIDVEKEFPSGSGDNGLDLVGWIEQDDSSHGILLSFGQCACTPEWVSKQHSSSESAWKPVFRFTVQPVNYCFIPFDFRDISGDWYRRTSVQGSILMDRRRIMAALRSDQGENGLSSLDTDVKDALDLNSFADALSFFPFPNLNK